MIKKHLLTAAFLMTLLACGQESDDITTSSTTFTPVQMPSGMTKKNTVYIFAPSHCPKEAGQRADSLENLLKKEGVTVIRKSRTSFSATNPSDEQVAKIEKTVEILNGEIPIVFVNNMGKDNPSIEQVLAIYQETK